MIGYFNFRQFEDDYLITNDLGRYAFVTEDELAQLVMGRIDSGSDIGKRLCDAGFLLDCSEEEYLTRHVSSLRGMKRPLFAPTSLHIVVVSTACNLDCVYCQAHSLDSTCSKLMSTETMRATLDRVFESPASGISLEFQGGEPLANFDVIKQAIEYAESRKDGRSVRYSIVSNLSLATDEMLEFFTEHHVGLSTSLDGPQALHDSNRPFKTGGGSFEAVAEGVARARQLGVDVSAIQTTTKASLKHGKEIVETYCDLGFRSMFVRPLTPLGVAKERWAEIGYTPQEFGEFYKDVLTAVLAKNQEGYSMDEGHARILLQKLLFGNAPNYMELRSPCGAGVGQLAYYVNGDVFTCDEGRMLHEMGDDSFKLGTVFKNTYSELISHAGCRAACAASVLETIPSCCDCAYQPYCGVCPVVNMALESDIIAREPNGYRCGVYSQIFDAIFGIIRGADKDILRLMRGWFE